MYNKALEARSNYLATVDNWGDFMEALGKKNIVLADWCDTLECETKVKAQSKEESI